MLLLLLLLCIFCYCRNRKSGILVIREITPNKPLKEDPEEANGVKIPMLKKDETDNVPKSTNPALIDENDNQSTSAESPVRIYFQV